MNIRHEKKLPNGGKVVWFSDDTPPDVKNIKTPMQILSLMGESYGEMETITNQSAKHLIKMIDLLVEGGGPVDMDNAIVSKLFDDITNSPVITKFDEAKRQSLGYKAK